MPHGRHSHHSRHSRRLGPVLSVSGVPACVRPTQLQPLNRSLCSCRRPHQSPATADVTRKVQFVPVKLQVACAGSFEFENESRLSIGHLERRPVFLEHRLGPTGKGGGRADSRLLRAIKFAFSLTKLKLAKQIGRGPLRQIKRGDFSPAQPRLRMKTERNWEAH